MVINARPSMQVKGLLGRGKAYLNKKEIIKGIMAICEGLKLFLNSKIYGQERIEIDYLLAELSQIISTIPEIKEYFPEDFGYSKGNEKKFLQDLVNIIKKIAKEIGEGNDKIKKELDEQEKKKKKLLEMLQEYISKKDYMGAGGVLKKILAEYGGSSDIFVDVANKFYSSGDYEQTIKFCKEALKKDPQNMGAYRMLINFYRFLKDYPAAEKYFKKSLEVFGEHGNIYFNMAKLYKEWQKEDKARASIKKALDLEPENKQYRALAKEILR
jgi:tetratricopeptide (TPR) repeat protein